MPQDEQERQTVTVAEAAEIFGVTPHTIYQQVKTGAVPCIKLGRRIVVPRKALNRLLEEGATVP